MRSSCLLAALILSACSRPEAPRTESVVTAQPVASKAPVQPSSRKPAARSFSNFVPSRDGFQFRNGFQGSIIGTGESAYGLCGGMSFAAADYFLANRPVPADAAAPQSGTPLFNYIYSRQATSFGTIGSMGLKFVEWMQLPDTGPGSAHARTLEELPHITAALSRGEPIVLGLVLTSTAAKGKAWDNHQVLAFAQAPVGGTDLAAPGAGSERPATATTILRIYDSNFPRRDDVTIAITADRIVQHIPGRRDISIRGFFRMAYSPIDPPQ